MGQGINQYMQPAEMQLKSLYTPLPLDWMYEQLQQKQAETDKYKQAAYKFSKPSEATGLRYMAGINPETKLFNEYNDVSRWNQGRIDEFNAIRSERASKILEAYERSKGDPTVINRLLEDANKQEKAMQAEEKQIGEVKANYEEQLKLVNKKELDENYQMLPVYQQVRKYIEAQKAGIPDNTFNPTNTLKYFNMQEAVQKNIPLLKATNLGSISPVLKSGKDFYYYADFKGVTGDALENMTNTLMNADPRFKKTLDEKWLYNKSMNKDFESYYSTPEMTKERRYVYDEDGKPIKTGKKTKDGKDIYKTEELKLTPYQAYFKDESIKLISYARGFKYETADRHYRVNPDEQKRKDLQAEYNFNEAHRPQIEQKVYNMDITDINKASRDKYSWFEEMFTTGTWGKSERQNAYTILKNRFDSNYTNIAGTISDKKLYLEGDKVLKFAHNNYDKPNEVKKTLLDYAEKLKKAGNIKGEYETKKLLNQYLESKKAEVLVEHPVKGIINYYKSTNSDLGNVIEQTVNTIYPGAEKKSKQEQETIMKDVQDKVNAYQNEQSSKYGLTDAFTSKESEEWNTLLFGEKTDGKREDNGQSHNMVFSYIKDGKLISNITYDMLKDDLGDDIKDKVNTIGEESLATYGKDGVVQTRPKVLHVAGEPGIEIYVGKDRDVGLNIKAMPYKAVFNAYVNGSTEKVSLDDIKNMSGEDIDNTKFAELDGTGINYNIVSAPKSIDSYQQVNIAPGIYTNVIVAGESYYDKTRDKIINDRKIYVKNLFSGTYEEFSYADFKELTDKAMGNTNIHENTSAPNYKTTNNKQIVKKVYTSPYE